MWDDQSLKVLNVDSVLEKLTREALTYTKGNRTEAAKLMGISVRTLRNWINKYKVAKPRGPVLDLRSE